VQRVSMMYAGDAVVQTPEQIEEELDEKRFRKELWAVLACIVVVVIGVAVGLAVALTPGGDGDLEVDGPAPVSTPAPTLSILTERAGILGEALNYLSSDQTVFDDLRSPQVRALTWLADRDEAFIDPEDSQRLEARYALATIYFATNGNIWLDNLGFLSSAHECDWSESGVGNATEPEPMQIGVVGNTTEPEPMQKGVFCNSDDEVLSLNLGTFAERVDVWDCRFCSD
jgi:hypothetical protein